MTEQAVAMNTNTTFRFKFTPAFLEELKVFSHNHKHDDPKDFKMNWDIWTEKHKEIIDRETKILQTQNYKGNIHDKMYKSARYYFKNKSTEKTKPKKRRQYVGINRDILDSMDQHIDNIIKNNFKPAQAYKSFMDDIEYKHLIDNEVTRLKNQELNREDIFNKFKKTYKNRYFIKKKNSV